jgi:hypothetical protein
MNDSVYAHDTRRTRISLHLLGGFGIVADGHQARLPFSAQRVLATLALRPADDWQAPPSDNAADIGPPPWLRSRDPTAVVRDERPRSRLAEVHARQF